MNRPALMDGIRACLEAELGRLAAKNHCTKEIARGLSALEESLFPQNFLNLFNSVYYATAGRGNTLIHFLMNEKTHDSRPTVLHFGVSESKENIPPEERRTVTTTTYDPADGQFLEKQIEFTLTEHLLGGRHKEILANKEKIDYWVAQIVMVLAAAAPAADRNSGNGQVTQAELSMLTGQLERRLTRSGVDHTRPPGFWPCYQVLGEDETSFQGGWYEPSNPEEGGDTTACVDRKVAMLRHFLLYLAFCGKHFYIFRFQGDPKLQMCLTVGVNEPLSEVALQHLVAIGEGLQLSLKLVFNTRTQKDTDERTKLDSALDRILGKDVHSALRDKLETTQLREIDEVRGLDRYVEFATEMAEIAIHEGKRLSFDFLVGDGLMASRHLEKVSALPTLGQGGEECHWNELPEGADPMARRKRQALTSLLLGNYSFLKRPAVLYGDHDGRLLWLARLLDQSSEVEITSDLGCYLVRIEANGDIRVFRKEKLVLWRHAGSFLVPQLHGKEYQQQLSKYLQDNFRDSGPDIIDLNLLAKVVWELSQDEDAGACFVLGDVTGGKFPLRAHTAALTHVLPFADGLALVRAGNEAILKQLAVQDGATLIDTKTGRVYGRRQLLGVGISAAHDYLGDAIERLKQNSPLHWHKLLRWGTRHHSAFAFASSPEILKVNRDDATMVVITISQDGDIHVLGRGELQDNLVYPSPVVPGALMAHPQEELRVGT